MDSRHAHDGALRGTQQFPFYYSFITPSHPSYEMANHWHNEVEIIRVVSGALQVDLEGESICLQHGDACFISSGQLHSGIPANCVYESLVFDLQQLYSVSKHGLDPFADIRDTNIQINPFISSCTTIANEMLPKLFEALHTQCSGYELIVLGQLFHMFGTILRTHAFSNTKTPNRSSRESLTKIKHVLNLINSRLDNPPSLSELAASVCLSPKYFSYIFKQVMQHTPSEYIIFRRIEHACYLMVATDKNVTEISQELGFNDIHYFSRCFKRYKLISPGSYIKSFRKKVPIMIAETDPSMTAIEASSDGAHGSVPYQMTKEQWLKEFTGSERDHTLLSCAYDVLAHNTIQNPKFPWGDIPVVAPWRQDTEAGIWGWETAFYAITTSRYNTALARNCIEAYTKFQFDNGMFPDVIYTTGKITSSITKPPVMAWASVELYRRDRNKAFLKTCYERYVKHEAFWYKERRRNGLFIYSHAFESGWDNSVRWDVGIDQLWPIDLHCYLIVMYRSLAFMAQELDDASLLPLWQEREKWLTEIVEQRFFSSELGAYSDVYATTGAPLPVLTPASFMPLYIGIASKEHAAAMATIARNHFYPGMPSVAYDHPEFSRNYWRGQTWLNISYFALKGLKQYGFHRLADDMREFLLSMVYNNLDQGIADNYDTLTQRGVFHSGLNWSKSAAFTIEFILNWEA